MGKEPRQLEFDFEEKKETTKLPVKEESEYSKLSKVISECEINITRYNAQRDYIDKKIDECNNRIELLKNQIKMSDDNSKKSRYKIFVEAVEEYKLSLDVDKKDIALKIKDTTKKLKESQKQKEKIAREFFKEKENERKLSKLEKSLENNKKKLEENKDIVDKLEKSIEKKSQTFNSLKNQILSAKSKKEEKTDDVVLRSKITKNEELSKNKLGVDVYDIEFLGNEKENGREK